MEYLRKEKVISLSYIGTKLYVGTSMTKLYEDDKNK